MNDRQTAGRLVVGIEALPVATVLTDGLTNVTAANSRAAALLGRAVDRMIGRPLAAFAASEDGRTAFGLARDALRRDVATGGHLTFDVGKRRNVRVAANVVRLQTAGDDDDRFDRLVWALSDVQVLAAELRELQRANERLARRLETAERKLATETRLLGELRSITDDAIRTELIARAERDLLLGVISEPVLRVDRAGFVIGGNDAAAELFGVEESALAGVEFDEIATLPSAPTEMRALVPFAERMIERNAATDVRVIGSESRGAPSATAAMRAGPCIVAVLDRPESPIPV